MSLKDDLKGLIIKSGWSMTEVVNEINRRNNQSSTLQNFSGKIRRETIKYKEVEEIFDIIGYHIEWVKNDTTKD